MDGTGSRPRIRWFIVIRGREVTLWSFTDAARIPKEPSSLRFNLWHPRKHWNEAGAAMPALKDATLSVERPCVHRREVSGRLLSTLACRARRRARHRPPFSTLLRTISVSLNTPWVRPQLVHRRWAGGTSSCAPPPSPAC